ncbi:hypothetical protein [Bdellovibrio bacteriovorus]|uniref:hypothetical protein n=1 Tax=Bdellovibrio bacteriovorus TaxID=959 RepID=UPI0035A69EB2
MFGKEILGQIRTNEKLNEFLGDLVVGTKDFHQDTRRTVDRLFPSPEAKDLLPTFRRASFETLISKAADALGLPQTPVLNQAKNSTHREIKIDDFLLVSHHVSSPGFLVRDSNFRKTLAANSQMSFFDEDEQESGHVFGVLLYGEFFNKEEDMSYPFLQLAFPNKELSDYVLKVDLLEMFKGRSKLDIANDVVQIADDVQPIFINVDLQKEL